MATLAADIRTVIVGSTDIAAVFPGVVAPGAVEHASVRENPPVPRLWYGLHRKDEELDLSNIGGMVNSQWDVEVHSDDDAESITIAGAVKDFVHGHIGTFGSRTAWSVKAEDHDEEYVPRGDASEDGIYVSAFQMTIWHDSTAST